MTIIEGTITALDADGIGTLVDESGRLVSIPGTLVGDVVEYKIESISRHHARAFGRSEGIVTYGPGRVRPICPLAWPVRGRCGGCPIMHMGPELQKEFKINSVLTALTDAGIPYIKELPYTGPEKAFRYRNRCDLIVSRFNGKCNLGAYEPRTHRVIRCTPCPVLRFPINQAIEAFTAAADHLDLPIYGEAVQTLGALRYVSFFSNSQGDVHIDIVCKSAKAEAPAWLIPFAYALRDFAPIKGISYSLNDSTGNAIRVEPSTHHWGLQSLTEDIGGVKVLLNASGFTQLNTAMAATIYAQANVWLEEKKPAVAWDLYCGAGALGQVVAPSRALYGAESNETALEGARKVTKDAPYEAHYECIDLETNLPQNWPKPDLVIVNPPRKGLSQKLIESLKECSCDILYMSCNPQSFAKNVAALSEHYVLEHIAAFDMLPQTRHVEVLGYLARR